MFERAPQMPGRKEESSLKEMLLNPDQTKFLEEKLSAYKQRVDEIESRYKKQFAVSNHPDNAAYYDSLAKWITTKRLLGGKVLKNGVQSFVYNSVQDFWENSNAQWNAEREKGMSQQRDIGEPLDVLDHLDREHGEIDKAIDTAWEIVARYNDGGRAKDGKI